MRIHAGLCLLALAAFCGTLASPARSGDPPPVEDVPVPTARGAALRATLHRPRAANGWAVVLAPGQGYHRELPLLKRSAEALADAGFHALRFDWAYFTAKGEPADDLAPEVADLDAAVAAARKVPGVARVIVAGKSLGSVVAAKWSPAHAKEVAALALLTPPVTDPEQPGTPSRWAAVLAAVPFEALVVAGDADGLAERRALYGLAARMERTPQIVVVPGDHGLAGPSKDETEKLENVDLAVRALVVWAKRRAAAK